MGIVKILDKAIDEVFVLSVDGILLTWAAAEDFWALVKILWDR